ncbi:phosphoribosylamine--glycine ligase [Ruminiclostridium herbifermentans]|uniref:Phosphoribosylamine--glycine ligase n=1 Tax=Ruminiclostridium herbifermentans TaxID=2488810 RepID=A0A4U7JBN1_9FIRM|nr:phosphoribosylamine--glycine ligase [Ruminiclostridium herbifermentans]QNU65869.1 phosphoribosylamine--glycine ligase [Ruminiclostridium herbifermentans]
MKVLVVGGGGREHTLVWKLSQSPKVSELNCAPGNGGISKLATCVDIKATDIDGIVNYSKENKMDLVVVAPDDPLAAGMVDKLNEAGIRAFGPVKDAAIIEGSKAFAKNLMKKYNIPTADYNVFENCSDALRYIDECGAPIVVKADGLALGKGVIIAKAVEEAKAAVNGMMNDKLFGNAGNKVVIEEFIEGPEVSILAFTDGKTIVPMVSSQDHKRVFDNDQGPNTGGMGTFSPSPLYDEKLADYCMKEIFVPTIEAMNKEGRKFKGVLYFGLMITKDGPKVLEYNARFGDPETQVVIPRLKTDLLEIFEAIIDEKLADINIEWDDNAAVCVVAASGGYPGKYPTGLEIKGLDAAQADSSTIVFHAGTSYNDGKFYTAGGRVLGVTAVEKTMDMAINKAYAGIEKISFEGMHYRKDIGRK